MDKYRSLTINRSILWIWNQCAKQDPLYRKQPLLTKTSAKRPIEKKRNRRRTKMAADESPAKKESLGPKLRRLLRNPTSMAGIALSIVSAANVFLFILIDLIGEHPSPYIGILAYIVAPGFMVFGLLLTAIGA